MFREPRARGRAGGGGGARQCIILVSCSDSHLGKLGRGDFAAGSH